MPRLPVLSGREAARRLEKLGYRLARQRGSHMRLVHPARKPLTVPNHPEVGKGLLRKILRDAEITVEEFLTLGS